jgi:hypothetical protein
MCFFKILQKEKDAISSCNEKQHQSVNLVVFVVAKPQFLGIKGYKILISKKLERAQSHKTLGQMHIEV